jgi:ring-1,2-phenylacetyl-CoA epoxidase subunit PaaD
MAETAVIDLDLARARVVAASVVDPEIPVLTLADLGVLRAVRAEGSTVVVEVSPTYLGCPAVIAIELAVETALRAASFDDVRIVRALSPAWSTDDITAIGREKLRAYGIAPPARRMGKAALFGIPEMAACPRCGSTHTERLSEFGSTACKALWRCRNCREPFDAFKCL